MGHTTDDLLTRAKLYSFFPSSTGGPPLTDAEILQLADDDLQNYVFPKVLASSGEWRVTDYAIALAASTSTYRLPSRAHLGRLRDLLYINASSERWSVPVIDPEMLGTLYTSAQTASSPDRFYFADGSIALYPAIGTSPTGSLLAKYYMRPGTLVATSAAACITAIGAADTGGAGYRRFTCSNVPASVTASVTLDLIRADGGFETSHIDLAVHARTVGASGTIDIIETALSTTKIAVGDYFCLAGESCIPQIPNAMHAWLARRTAVCILEQTDPTAIQRAQDKADETESAIVSTLGPRIDGEPMPMINPFSTLRQLMS